MTSTWTLTLLHDITEKTNPQKMCTRTIPNELMTYITDCAWLTVTYLFDRQLVMNYYMYKAVIWEVSQTLPHDKRAKVRAIQQSKTAAKEYNYDDIVVRNNYTFSIYVHSRRRQSDAIRLSGKRTGIKQVHNTFNAIGYTSWRGTTNDRCSFTICHKWNYTALRLKTSI